MKQVLFKCVLVIASALFLTGCEEHAYYESEQSTERYFKKTFDTIIYSIEIEGHKYIIFNGFRKGGIIHSESCPCMKEKKETK